LKVGERVANRQEQDDITNYNWTALSPVWDPQLNYLSAAAPGDTTLATYPNFFRGQTPLPSAVVLPSLGLVGTYDVSAIHRKYGQPGDTQGPTTFTPNDLSHGHTRSEAGYFMLSFGKDEVFGVPMSGNIGARIVHYENSATGFILPPSGTITLCNPDGTASAGCTPTNYPLGSGNYYSNGGGSNYTRALPALNVQFLLEPQLHLRVAASQSLTNPDFSQMSAAGTSSFVTQSVPGGNAQAIIGATATTGNPNLRPQISTNGDVSLEWYPKPNFETHLSLFYKDIHDYLSYGTLTEQLPFVFPNNATKTLTTAVNGWYNQPRAVIIKGAEFGFQSFADFLPAPWNGLGAQVNYTYIQSYAPGDRAFDMLGNPIRGLPVDQLSKHNYNLVAMYERNPWSIRLAYTWRSRYLLTTNSNGTASTFDAPAGVTTNPNPIIFSLPVFSDSYGQLDAGVTFHITNDLAASAEGQNLTNTLTKTLMGYGDQQYGRNFFITDRRYVLTLRYSMK
jgi:iron complex outermembrane receptor protein